MKNKMPKISDAEWQVMKILWQHAPQTANEIVDKLADPNNWSPRTVKTLLNRLVNKGALGFEIDGRTYLYSPLLKEKECTREARKSFLSRVYGGALQPMLAAFLEDEKLSPEEIEELKQILEKKQEKY
jgi:BlaI family penicillinase repressor